MKDKKSLLMMIVIAVLSVIIVIESVYLVVLKKSEYKNNESSVDETEVADDDLKEEYPRIKNLLSSSSAFGNSKLVEDRENGKLVIDDKYTVGLKKGSIYLEIEYGQDTSEYCKVIEAIEESLGSVANVREACENSLNGSLVNDYIFVSYEQYGMYVIVNTESAMKNYNTDVYATSKRIDIENPNIGISIDGYNMTISSPRYTENVESTELCFSIVNMRKIPRDFIVSFYDENGNILKEKTISYTGENIPAEYFWIDYENTNVKTFSIN